MTGSLLVKLVFTYTIGDLEITSEKSDRLPPKRKCLESCLEFVYLGARLFRI